MITLKKQGFVVKKRKKEVVGLCHNLSSSHFPVETEQVIK